MTDSVSIVIIFNDFREQKLTRLLKTIKPQLPSPEQEQNSEQNENEIEIEVLLIHESNYPLTLPELPVKVRYINIPEKQGFSFNRNQGIKHVQGDIIVFIDDDCWVTENWFDSLLRPLKDDQQLLAVTSGTKVPSSNLLGNCIATLGFPGGGSLGFEKVWPVSKESFTNHLAVGNCALRKEIFEKIGYFDESMKSGAEDAEFSFRLEKANIPIKYVPEAFAYHEARDSFSSFIKWQLRRGKANYQFKQKVGNVGSFVKLRFWSAKNILKKNRLNPWLFLILFLLFFSFTLQQIGYIIYYYKDKTL